MRYPKDLRPSDTVGVCATSSGVEPNKFPRLEKAIANVRALGYEVAEAPSLRKKRKCVSAPAHDRAAEFMAMWEDPAVKAIIPPWGGDFLMEILPLLDWERLAALPPKWLSGYSDTTTLSFPLTTMLDVATIHGTAFMNLGYREIHSSDLRVFEAMAAPVIEQESAAHYGNFVSWTDPQAPVYRLDQPSVWKSLSGGSHSFEGRMIGGCMDTLCKLLGTPYAPVEDFLRRYHGDGFIWAMESCEMRAADLYRTLWQMREAGWFERCAGVLIGRPDGYSDTGDFTLEDVLHQSFDVLGCPVIYDCDIGHIPPQMQIINGARARVDYANGRAKITQEKI